MRTWIYGYHMVEAPPHRVEETLVRSARELVRLATAAPDAPPAADGSFLVDLEGAIAWCHTAKRVRMIFGPAKRTEPRVVVPVQWYAEPLGWLFPAFTGTIEVQALDGHRAQLTLAGSYRVPLGPLGWLPNRTVLWRVAQATADQLLSALSRELARAVAHAAPLVGANGR